MDQSPVLMSHDDLPAIQETIATEPGRLTFSGNEDDSVTDFIQSIQKHAFEEDRTTDDRWIVAYIGTCFTDTAMVWYSLLDDKTRNNWTKLRKAMITRFGPKPTYTNASLIGQLPSCQRSMGLGPIYSPQMGPISTREKAPNELRGQIEVFVPDRNLFLGYLMCSYEPAGTTFTVSGSKTTSALFSFVPDAESKPVQIRIDGGGCDVYNPYIGLAMDDPSLQLQPQNVMCQLPGAPQPYYTGNPITQQYTPRLPVYGQAFQMATSSIFQNAVLQQALENKSTSPSWILKTCTESSQDERHRRASKTSNLWEKASAAVWKYDPNTKELGLTWMNDDGSEEQLAVSVPKPTGYGGIVRPILHRTQDNATEAPTPGQTPVPQNIPVKFFFVPED